MISWGVCQHRRKCQAHAWGNTGSNAGGRDNAGVNDESLVGGDADTRANDGFDANARGGNDVGADAVSHTWDDAGGGDDAKSDTIARDDANMDTGVAPTLGMFLVPCLGQHWGRGQCQVHFRE